MLELSTERQVEVRCKTGRALPLVRLRVNDEESAEVPADGKISKIALREKYL